MENIFRALTKLRDDSAPGTRLAEAVEVTIEILNRSGYRAAFETACEREERTGPEDLRSAYHTVRVALTPVLASRSKHNALVDQMRKAAAADLVFLLEGYGRDFHDDVRVQILEWATLIREGKVER